MNTTYRVYLLTPANGEVVYYEGDNYFLAKAAVDDFNSKAFEARLEEI